MVSHDVYDYAVILRRDFLRCFAQALGGGDSEVFDAAEIGKLDRISLDCVALLYRPATSQ